MRNFKVKGLFSSKQTEIIVTAKSANDALIISRKMYPNGRFFNAKPI